MKTFRNILGITIIILIGTFLIFNKNVTEFISNNFFKLKEKEIYLEKNEYAKEHDYAFVQITDKFTVTNYQELLNAFYTILDSGIDEFTFYCDKEYKECDDDINKIIPSDEEADDIMAELNNFVHPYNSYKNIVVTTNNYGKINIKFEKIYSKEMIEDIENYINEFIETKISPDDDDYKKISLFHDYIINNTKYDAERANDVNSEQYKDSPSHTAYGVSKNHIALCGGYSDMMAIYLNKLGIDNIKIAAKLHVWNLIYYNNSWLNLDVTWDDPVTNTGDDLLIKEYFLVDSDTLFNLDNIEHVFNENIYVEAKEK